MLFYGEFGAWITIDERTLDEYGIQTDLEQKKVICYVASEQGKSFQVHWCDRKFESPTRGRVHIDGRSIGGKIIRSSTGCTVTKKGYRTSSNKRRPFVFSKVRLTDEEDDHILSLNSENHGEISIEIVRVRVQDTKVYTATHIAPETRIFNERKLKGSTHNTTFGITNFTGTTVYHETEPYGDPVARFCFRYMPIEMLRAKDIAPYPGRKRPFPQDEVEELKPDLTAISVTSNSPSRSASTVSTLVESSSKTISESSRASSVSTLVASSPATRTNTVKKERTEHSPPLKQRRTFPSPQEVIDLTHL